MLAALIVMAPFAQAQDEDKVQPQSDSKDTMAEEGGTDGEVAQEGPNLTPSGAEQESDGSSQFARSMTRAGAQIGAGFFVGAVPGTQLVGYYSIMPDLQLGLSYGFGSYDLSSTIDDTSTTRVDEALLSATLLSVNAQYFVGNSFYVVGGLGQRTVNADFDIQSTLIDYGLKGTLESNTTVLVLGLGNQWQWDSGFTLGVEWIGYAVAMGASSSGNLDETGTAAASAPASQKDDLDKLESDANDTAETIGELSSPRLLMLSLGWAF
jgi:hypothetical protein